MNDFLYLNSPAGEILFPIEPGKILECGISWDFTHIHISNRNDVGDLPQFFSSGFSGASHLLGDGTLVFDEETLLLQQISLDVPEKNQAADQCLNRWLDTSCRTGLPKASSKLKFPWQSPVDFRHLSKDGRFLFCAADSELPLGPKERLRIHPRVDLLLYKSRYFGFLLRNPVRSLVRFSGEPGNRDADVELDFLVAPLRQYLDLIQEKNWDLLESKNVIIKNELESIARYLSSRDKSVEPVYALHARCIELLEDYYE